jgi:hypothetical protein
MATKPTSLSEASTQLATNLDYAETGSVTSAQDAAVAIRYLLAFRPNSSSEAGRSMQFDVNQLEKMNKQVTAFIRAKSGAGGTIYPDFNYGFGRD